MPMNEFSTRDEAEAEAGSDGGRVVQVLACARAHAAGGDASDDGHEGSGGGGARCWGGGLLTPAGPERRTRTSATSSVQRAVWRYVLWPTDSPSRVLGDPPGFDQSRRGVSEGGRGGREGGGALAVEDAKVPWRRRELTMSGASLGALPRRRYISNTDIGALRLPATQAAPLTSHLLLCSTKGDHHLGLQCAHKRRLTVSRAHETASS